METIKTVAATLKILNEYHEPNPVVFSVAPGSLAPTVDVPAEQLPTGVTANPDAQIGPICRRILLALRQALIKNKSGQTIQEFVQQITGPGLDAQSTTSVSHYEPDDLGAWSLFRL